MCYYFFVGILNRLFQALQWLAFFPFLISVFLFGVSIQDDELWPNDDEEFLMTTSIVAYLSIILIRWILFHQWYFLPWQKK